MTDATDGRFKPGHAGSGRRRAGTPNKITKDIKTGIIDAAVKHGFDGKGKDGLVGYCHFLASRHPKAFASLLGRLLPLQVSGDVKVGVTEVKIVSVPPDRYLSADDIKKLYPSLALEPPDSDDVIEHEPATGDYHNVRRLDRKG